MSVVVSFGINVFVEKFADFDGERLKYQTKKKKYPKRSFPIKQQEYSLIYITSNLRLKNLVIMKRCMKLQSVMKL